jgi:hypothetical protein
VYGDPAEKSNFFGNPLRRRCVYFTKFFRCDVQWRACVRTEQHARPYLLRVHEQCIPGTTKRKKLVVYASFKAGSVFLYRYVFIYYYFFFYLLFFHVIIIFSRCTHAHVTPCAVDTWSAVPLRRRTRRREYRSDEDRWLWDGGGGVVSVRTDGTNLGAPAERRVSSSPVGRPTHSCARVRPRPGPGVGAPVRFRCARVLYLSLSLSHPSSLFSLSLLAHFVNRTVCVHAVTSSKR